MDKIAVADIKVGARIREDKGDVTGMAESIAKYGLIEPIIIAGEDNALICGERRLLGAKQLGLAEVDVVVRWKLSPEERWALEREENEQRKGLTEGERSKRYAAAKVLAEKAERARAELLTSGPVKSGGRPPAKGVSQADVAQVVGVPRTTLNDAEQHVAAAERYPELRTLQGIPRADAIVIARNLDKLPEPERDEKRAAMRRYDQSVVAELADKPPMPPKPEPRTVTVGERWGNTVSKLAGFVGGIRDAGGMRAVATPWSRNEQLGELTVLRGLRQSLQDFERELEELTNVTQSA